MHQKKIYEKPVLSVVAPEQPTWHEQLPKIRKLTEEALRSVQEAGDDDIARRLVKLLETIDNEIEATDERIS